MANSLLAKSAQGATLLILLQVGSRALTFIVNQVLLRYLSPQILGVSTQLELLSISTLYFARESIRVALQRQRGENEQAKTEKADEGDVGETKKEGRAVSSYEPSRRIQGVVNVSYTAIGLGIPLTLLFGWLYLRNADIAVLQTPHIERSLQIYAFATIVELFNEPLFAVAQQQMLYGTRASSEMLATFSKCIVNSSIAIWASRSGIDLGVLPFAIGQLTYAFVLFLGYLTRVIPICKSTSVSLIPKFLPQTNSLLPHSLITLAATLYGQSIFKQLLTSGDSYLIATLTSLPVQGAYALAANYGALIARILFQPIEESSRSLFARLLPPQSQSTPTNPDPNPTDTKAVAQASKNLTTILHLYSLLSLFAITLGPPLSPLLLRTIAGPRWTKTEAPSVLAAYCYYIPFLATNGILEAFVSAVATEAQIRNQGLWSIAFSCVFVGTGYLALSIADLGARGLVLANAVNMAARITWSWRFVNGYLRRAGRGGETLDWEEMVPSRGALVVGVFARFSLAGLAGAGDGGLGDLITAGVVVGGAGVGV